MFDNDLEKRVEALERLYQEQDKINRLFTESNQFTTKHSEMIQNLISSHEMLFEILIKAGVIDKKRYKKEYNKFLFHYGEAKGILQELKRQWQKE